jgi:hypothetical protein
MVKLDYDTTPRRARRPLWRVAVRAVLTLCLAAAVAIVAVIGTAAFVYLRQRGQFDDQFRQETAVLKSILAKDPSRYAGVTIDEESSKRDEAALYGTVATRADSDQLLEQLRPHFGQGGARHRVHVEVKPPDATRPSASSE